MAVERDDDRFGNYRTQTLYVDQAILATVRVQVCDACGSVVINEEQHATWHRLVEDGIRESLRVKRYR